MKSQASQIDIRAIRRRLGMNQQQFWAPIGVTQSGGSRYESGRAIPEPVRKLLDLVYVKGVDLETTKAEDMHVVRYLAENEPAQLKELRKLARAWKKG